MQMKKLFLLFLVPGLMFLLTGCETRVNESDIKKYVKKTYGFRDFEIEKNTVTVDNVDGLQDEIWTVITKDRWNTEFNVLVRRTTSSAGTKTVLSDNYYDIVLARVAGDYQFDFLELKETGSEEYHTYVIEGHFSNQDELKSLFDETDSFCEALKNDDTEIEVPVLFCVDTPFGNRLAGQPDGSMEYQPGDCCYQKTFHPDMTKKESEKAYTEALTVLVQVAMDYGLEESLVGISEKDLMEIFDKSCSKIGIVRDGKGKEAEYYDGMCANRLGYGISFGNLYRVLVCEGFDVEGDERHYSFDGADGNTYEISYDFVDVLKYRNETHKGYFYRMNGEVIPMRFYFYNHFSQDEVETMTGIRLVW